MPSRPCLPVDRPVCRQAGIATNSRAQRRAIHNNLLCEFRGVAEGEAKGEAQIVVIIADDARELFVYCGASDEKR